MRIVMESTDNLVMIDGRPVRVWHGRTEGGNLVQVFVALVGAISPAAHVELERELDPQPPPEEAWPLGAVTKLLELAERGNGFHGFPGDDKCAGT